jgi:hypothetical protein
LADETRFPGMPLIHLRYVTTDKLVYSSSSLNDADQEHYDCEHKQNMDEPTHGITAYQSECPQNR